MGFEKVLIVKPSAFGDVVHSLPFLGALRRAHPEARIGWVVARSCAGLLEGHPDVDDLYVFERERWGGFRNLPRTTREFFAFARRLRAQRFDLVVDLQGLFRSAFLTRLTGAPERVGFRNARELGWMFYTRRVRVPDREMHAVDRYLLVAHELGLAIERPVRFNVHVSDDARAFAREWFTANSGGRPVVAMLPGSQWPSKRWPAEHFAALATRLEDQGARVVLLGGPGDVALVERIRGMMIRPAESLAGRTTIPQLTAVLERASAVVANDSGPMHLAVALERPVVALFGPTSPERTGPYVDVAGVAQPPSAGVVSSVSPQARAPVPHKPKVLRSARPCAPCFEPDCENPECMRDITVDRVFEAACCRP